MILYSERNRVVWIINCCCNLLLNLLGSEENLMKLGTEKNLTVDAHHLPHYAHSRIFLTQ